MRFSPSRTRRGRDGQPAGRAVGRDDDGPAAPPATGPKAPPPKGRRSDLRSLRRRSREIALQGLYEWLLSKEDAGVIDAHMREHGGFDECDAAHFELLLHGCIGEADELDKALAKHLDRRTALLSPVDELKHCIDIPYRVAINEAVELAKSFGGTDGHKYVNGVLDKAAADLRPVEVQAMRAARR